MISLWVGGQIIEAIPLEEVEALQDIVTEDYSAVESFSPFRDFVNSPPIPVTKDSYLKYAQLATNFIEARNRRIFSHYN